MRWQDKFRHLPQQKNNVCVRMSMFVCIYIYTYFLMHIEPKTVEKKKTTDQYPTPHILKQNNIKYNSAIYKRNYTYVRFIPGLPNCLKI